MSASTASSVRQRALKPCRLRPKLNVLKVISRTPPQRDPRVRFGYWLLLLVGIPELQVATLACFVDRAADLGDLVDVAGVDGADGLERRRV